ncbi:hypothetical protein Tco_0452438 [Tanacetum coccineum]
MVTKNKLGQGNERLKGRDWNEKDIKRSKEMLNKIDQVMKYREQLRHINNKSFEINDLKAQLQDKSIVVNELKKLLAKLKGKSQVTKCETPDFDSRFQKLDDKNVVPSFSGPILS